MTNEELIAQARELCETIGEFAINEIDEWEINLRSSPDNKSWKDRLATATGIYRLVTTHLAEMDEHKAIEHCKNPLCPVPVCSKCGSKDTLEVSYPCNYLLTKAQRLLRVG